MPLVTIGIPIWNAAGTLRTAIASVLASQYGDFELLLVDDGSADNSLRICREFCDPRIRVLFDDKHLGLVARLNQIAAQARSPFLARMDADDLMHPERIRRQMEFLQANRHLQVVGSGAYVIDEADRVVGVRCCEPPEFTLRAAVRGSLLIHPTVMGRTQWFRENTYDAGFVRAEDHELWCRTVATGVLGHIPAPLHFYRERFKNAAGTYRKSCKSDRAVIRKYGPQAFGSSGTSLLLLLSSMKELGMLALSLMDLERLAVSRRNRAVPKDGQASAELLLQSLRLNEAVGNF